MEIDVTIKNKDGSVEHRKYGAQEKYDKEHTTRLQLKLNNKTDADVLAWLDKQPSKQGAIKALIRAKIEQENA